MGLYDKYIEQMEKEEAFSREQGRLHRKHDDIDPDTVIVEKSNTVKFTLTFLRSVVKTVAAAMLILLAAIGLIALIYPDVRAELVQVAIETFDEIRGMI